jgi:hypothetical protein
MKEKAKQLVKCGSSKQKHFPEDFVAPIAGMAYSSYIIVR